MRVDDDGPQVGMRSPADETDVARLSADGLHAPARSTPSTRSATCARGSGTTRRLGALLADGLHDAAAQPFTVRSDRRPYRGTLGDVDALARRVATGLRARGIEPGDAVAFQLPNWLEAAATFYAIAYLGAVVVPIVHFYGPKEVGYILRTTRVKALVTADRFGHQDFLANLDAHARRPARSRVGRGRRRRAGRDRRRRVRRPRRRRAARRDPPPVDPRAPALVAYTSGTTSDPKGVVHSHRTINAEIRQLGGDAGRAAAAPRDRSPARRSGTASACSPRC